MVLRIGGLATGMDIDSIVADLMRTERIPLDKLTQERQLWEWKQEDYREINSSLASLREQVFDLKLQSTFLSKKATSSNEAAVEVTAGTSAMDGVYTLEIQNMARGVNKASVAELADEKDANGNTVSLATQFGFSGTITFTLTGKKNGVEKSKDFSFDTASKNIYDVVNEINAADLGINASYDADLNRFFLTTSTGADQMIKVTNDSNNFLSDAVGDGSGNKLKLAIVTGAAYNGEDAQVKLGDATFNMASNTFTINGMTFNLKDEPSDPSSPIMVDITVTQDTDRVFNSIKEFVDTYNETIGKIYDKLKEERYWDYPPLTDAQKEEMSDKQIELWEEKARSGLLSNDSLLNSVVSKIRMSASSIVSGLSGYDSLAEIGITTKSYEYLGQMEIDEDKLKEALSKDIDGVMKLFTNSSSVDGEKGIAVRIYDEVVNGIDRISDRAGSSSSFSLVDNSFIGKKLKYIDEKIDEWEERLAEIEDRYWRQFTVMEKAINQMNMQSAWLAQQLGLAGQ